MRENQNIACQNLIDSLSSAVEDTDPALAEQTFTRFLYLLLEMHAHTTTTDAASACFSVLAASRRPSEWLADRPFSVAIFLISPAAVPTVARHLHRKARREKESDPDS
jgi:hypothetical protein